MCELTADASVEPPPPLQLSPVPLLPSPFNSTLHVRCDFDTPSVVIMIYRRYNLINVVAKQVTVEEYSNTWSNCGCPCTLYSLLCFLFSVVYSQFLNLSSLLCVFCASLSKLAKSHDSCCQVIFRSFLFSLTIMHIRYTSTGFIITFSWL